MDVEHDEVRQEEDERDDPHADNDDPRSGRRAAELERVADGVPPLDGDHGEGEHGHGHRHALEREDKG